MIWLRKAEDTRAGNTGWRTDTCIKSEGLSWLYGGMRMLESGSASEWSLAVGERADHRAAARNSWRVRGWCGDRSHRRAGEGGSSGSLRSSGENWSEQAGDCSCCLIRTDVTQHNPPQQFVLRLEQVIFEKKVQAACEAAALCPMTARPVNHGAHLSCAHTSPHVQVLRYWGTVANYHMHTHIVTMLVLFQIDLELSKANLDSGFTVGWYVSGPAEQNSGVMNQWEGPKQKGAMFTAKIQAYLYRAVSLKVNQEHL